jgi:hypothetical protein
MLRDLIKQSNHHVRKPADSGGSDEKRDDLIRLRRILVQLLLHRSQHGFRRTGWTRGA